MFGLRGVIACAGTLATNDDAANANVRLSKHSGGMCVPAAQGKPKKTSVAGTLTSEEVAICLSGAWIRVNGTLVSSV